MYLVEAATHFLESQGQTLSGGSKSSSPQKPLTNWRTKDRYHQQAKSSSPQEPPTHWRAKDRHCQWGPNPAHHGSHSLSGEPRTGVVSRVQIRPTTEATHWLESQGQAS